MSASRASLAWIILASLAVGMAGCGPSSASFPYNQDVVWRAVVTEAVAWRPTLIDDQEYLIRCDRSDLSGGSSEYEVRVGRDWNLLAPKPSTSVSVSIKQTAPTTRRFRQLEQEFLLAVARLLAAASQSQGS
jgi:hypothetical protein